MAAKATFYCSPHVSHEMLEEFVEKSKHVIFRDHFFYFHDVII